MISNLAYVHPDAKIGQNVTIEPFAYIAGDVEIGDGCWIGPSATIHDGARIGKNCKIFPGAVISAVPQDLKFRGEKSIVKIGNNRYVANMFAQERYGYNGIRYTSYDAIDKCLKSVARNCENGEITRVAMPYKMSSDRKIKLNIMNSCLNNKKYVIIIHLIHL